MGTAGVGIPLRPANCKGGCFADPWNRWRGPFLRTILPQKPVSSPRPAKPMSTPILVVALCLGAAAFGALGNVVVRLMSAEIEALEIAFFRNLFGFLSALVLLPLAASPGQSMLAGAFAIPGRMWLAAGLNLISMSCFFTAVALMPLGDLTALSFAVPVWLTIGGALLLGENAPRSRWIATAGGVVGVLVILRPGLGTLSPPALLVLTGTVAFALSSLTVKVAARNQTPLAIVFQLSLLMTVISFAPALAVWRWPSLEGWLLGALLGTLATLGWYTLTRALSLADASATAPYDFARLPFTIVPAYFLFGESPDAFAMLGSAIIFAAAMYASRQEVRRSR
jgi:drug/metabolite transporter (DMT)-like permease